jgi:hypothetical protein
MFAVTRADLCWRAKANANLPVLERLADGSYRSELVGFSDRQAREHGTPVRVVEYALDDPGRPQAEDNRYRLVTTIVEAEEAPAAELAALYAERWEFESALDELKTHQRGPRVVLRSKTPEGARQEASGLDGHRRRARGRRPRQGELHQGTARRPPQCALRAGHGRPGPGVALT